MQNERRPQDNLPNAIIQTDTTNWSSLHDAAAHGDEKKLQILLSTNAERTTKESKNGNTPLHEAATRGYSRCVKMLCTPPHSKAERKDEKQKGISQETREMLHSSVLNIQNYGGFTALHLAVQNGHNQSCRELLLAGADPDRQNYYGDTALHTACRYGHAGATRILLSAYCNTNKVNLNGDTPLHITCAMGRHKLTRILLEAECKINIKNAQGERPRDIAIRKNFLKILDILNNPHRMRNKKEKKPAPNVSAAEGCVNGINWSPYGCHYFPDRRAFPSPKLETLPKEPLKKGEQYFLDLAGHIRKGPIGIGNTCYCGPFFKHIEDKINSNRKSMRKYVHHAKESLGNKVQALAMRTNDQIEQLTRSMIADRVQCESRRILFEHWLKRGDQLRCSAEPSSKAKLKANNNADGTLKRCRSLELLDNDNFLNGAISNSKSCDILKDIPAVESDNVDGDYGACKLSLSISPDSTANAIIDEDILSNRRQRWDELNTDYTLVSKRLGNLLEQTNVFLEAPTDARQEAETKQLSATEMTKKKHNTEAEVSTQANVRDASNSLANTTQVLKRNEIRTYPIIHQSSSTQSETLNLDALQLSAASAPNSLEPQLPLDFAATHNNNEWRFAKPPGAAHIKNEHMLQSVISALRKDHQKVQATLDAKTLNETEHISEDKLSYKDEKSLLNVNGLFQNRHLADTPPHIEAVHLNGGIKTAYANEKESRETFIRLNENQRKTKNLQTTTNRACDPPLPAAKFEEPSRKGINSIFEKIEIKNSEIKSLRKPAADIEVIKRSKVQDLVSRLQGKLSLTQKVVKPKTQPEIYDSESSEDEQNCQNEYHRGNNFAYQYGGNTAREAAWQNQAYSNQQFRESTSALDNSYSLSSCTDSPNSINNAMYYIDEQQTSPQMELRRPLNLSPERFIPKDAYFHDISDRNRQQRYIAAQAASNARPLSSNANYAHFEPPKNFMSSPQPRSSTLYFQNSAVPHINLPAIPPKPPRPPRAQSNDNLLAEYGHAPPKSTGVYAADPYSQTSPNLQSAPLHLAGKTPAGLKTYGDLYYNNPNMLQRHKSETSKYIGENVSNYVSSNVMLACKDGNENIQHIVVGNEGAFTVEFDPDNVSSLV